ncbi:MAG: DMT family transporter [Alphaproteobacteria bacterium]|nr:DMT family transporter [Alphaproteobacteria bacterium]
MNTTNNRNLYGALLIVLVAVFAAASNSLTHSLPKNFPTTQALFLKAGIGLLFVSVFYSRKLTAVTQTKFLPWQIFKGITGALGNWFLIASVQLLPLADSSALSLTSALMTTLGAYCFFGEKLTRPILYSLGIGFAGVLIILRPSSGVFTVYALYPLLSALAFSASSLIIKKVSIRDSSATTLFYLLFFMTLFSAGPAFWNWYEISSLALFLKLAGISALYVLGQFALIEAYTHAAASFIAPFKFSRFPLAVVSGFLFFEEQAAWTTLIGASMIIGSYIYLIKTNKKLK